MRARPFATLVSSGSLGLFATQLPTVLKLGSEAGSLGMIECHLARANPHWNDLAEGGEALMIFHGAQGYISPNWYPSKAANHKVVPTWNYATVHAYGRPVVMDQDDWKRRHVAELTDQQEQASLTATASAGPQHGASQRPWSLSDAPEEFVATMLRAIIGFRFAINRLEGKAKLSQNRDSADRLGVAAGLEARGANQDAEMATLVAALLPK